MIMYFKLSYLEEIKYIYQSIYLSIYFTALNEIYLVFTEKKSIFSFYFILNGELQKAQPKFFPGRFSFDLTSRVCLLVITLGETKFALENGLELHFNE